jgi:hypothetical protein
MSRLSTVTQSIAPNAAAVTPHDTNPNVWSYLYVGTGGNISIVTEAGDTVLLTAVPAGSYLWIRTSKVRSTNTTASNIVGHR